MMDPWLAMFIRKESPNCPLCGRPLQIASEDRCANCNSTVMLGLATPAGFWLAWGLMLSALAAMAGFGGLLLALKFMRDLPMLSHQMFDICMYAGPFAFLVAIFAFTRRRAFGRAPHGLQWTFAIAAAIALATQVLLFFFSMR